MAKALIGWKVAGASLSTNSVTVFAHPGCGTTVFSTTESTAKFRVGKAGVVSKFSTHIFANTRSTTCTLRVRKNGANGNGIISITAGSTGFFVDASNTDSFAVGDDLNFSLSTLTGGGTLSIDGMWAAYEATSGFASFFMCTPSSIVPSFSTASASAYNFICGDSGVNFTTTENDRVCTIRAAGTFRNLFGNVTSNARGTTTTFRFRVNNADVNQAISIGAGATGFFEDTSNTDLVSSGNTVTMKIATGTGGGAIAFDRMGVTFDGSSNQHDVFAFRGASIQRLFSSTDIFPDFWGSLGVGNTTESRGQVRVPFDCRVDRLRVKVFNNTNTMNYRLRKNGADGNQIVSIPNGSTGLFEDTTSVDDLVAGDDLGIKGFSVNNTSSYAYFGLRINEPFVPASGGGNRRVCIMQ